MPYGNSRHGGCPSNAERGKSGQHGAPGCGLPLVLFPNRARRLRSSVAVPPPCVADRTAVLLPQPGGFEGLLRGQVLAAARDFPSRIVKTSPMV